MFKANRRAGNSDGAYLLSHFRRLLNPCQVLDLAIHSPSLVVKWCSVAPPDVTLYVLVSGGDGTVAWVLNTLNECNVKGVVSYTKSFFCLDFTRKFLHNFLNFRRHLQSESFHWEQVMICPEFWAGEKLITEE